MSIVIEVLASIGGVVVGVSVLWGVHDWALRLIESRADRKFYEGSQHARQCMVSDAYWFSEDPLMQEVLLRLARGQDIGQVREYWRSSRKKDLT